MTTPPRAECTCGAAMSTHPDLHGGRCPLWMSGIPAIPPQPREDLESDPNAPSCHRLPGELIEWLSAGHEPQWGWMSYLNTAALEIKRLRALVDEIKPKPAISQVLYISVGDFVERISVGDFVEHINSHRHGRVIGIRECRDHTYELQIDGVAGFDTWWNSVHVRKVTSEGRRKISP